MPENIVMLSGGTDGNDGPTDAAEGLNAVEFLDDNDSYNYLKKTGDLLITGPTKTNVMDVRMVLVR